MVIRILIPIITLISNFAFANYPIFDVESSWEFVQPKDIPKSIELTFIKKTSEIMPLSITFARESITSSQEKYIEFVEKMYEKEAGFEVHSLGKSNKRHLLQIEAKNGQFGAMKIWQAIQVVDSIAYVLTLSGPEKSFEKSRSEFSKIIESFQVLDQPLDYVPKERKNRLIELIRNLKLSKEYQQGGFQSPDFQKKDLLRFKKTLIKEFSDLSPIWQLQLIAYLSNHLEDV